METTLVKKVDICNGINPHCALSFLDLCLRRELLPKRLGGCFLGVVFGLKNSWCKVKVRMRTPRCAASYKRRRSGEKGKILLVVAF